MLEPEALHRTSLDEGALTQIVQIALDHYEELSSIYV